MSAQARSAARRAALVDAAGALVTRGGPAAVTARAAATAAGVPLAAVTYYFSDVDELARAGAAQVLAEHLGQAREALSGLRRDASDRTVAARLVAAALGPYAAAGPSGVAALYERTLAAASRPTWRADLAAWDRAAEDVVGELLAAAGRDPRWRRAVLACLDGLAISAVVRGASDPAAEVAAQLVTVLPALAPVLVRDPTRDGVDHRGSAPPASGGLR